MLVQWERRKVKPELGDEGGDLLCATLVAGESVAGNSDPKFITRLGIIKEQHLTNAWFLVDFWQAVEGNLAELDLSTNERNHLKMTIAQTAPKPTPEQIDQVQQKEAKIRAEAEIRPRVKHSPAKDRPSRITIGGCIRLLVAAILPSLYIILFCLYLALFFHFQISGDGFLYAFLFAGFFLGVSGGIFLLTFRSLWRLLAVLVCYIASIWIFKTFTFFFLLSLMCMHGNCL